MTNGLWGSGILPLSFYGDKMNELKAIGEKSPEKHNYRQYVEVDRVYREHPRGGKFDFRHRPNQRMALRSRNQAKIREAYKTLGEEATYQQVAEFCGKSLSWVWRYKTTYDL